jgi:hypothetical protein
MSVEKGNKKWGPLPGVFLSVIVTFSMLLVFSERISSKPTEAGFWMILVFGASLGVALTVSIMQVSGRNKL